MTFPETLSKEKIDLANPIYFLYFSDCNEVQKIKKNEAIGGEIGQAFDQWCTEEDKLNTKNLDIENAKEGLENSLKALNKALDKANESGSKLNNDMKGKVDAVLQSLNHANSVDPEIVSKERLAAITTLLTAAAGGEINTSNPDNQSAAIIAKEIPSLAADIKGLMAKAKAPSVRNLLMEMRHQVLLLQYANQLRSLDQEKVDILKTKYDALMQEAGCWLDFGDAICRFAVLSGISGAKCDVFKIVTTDDGKTTCYFDQKELKDCALCKPWKVNIQAANADADATRELYKALAAYLRALNVQEKQTEQEFRLIDLDHRKILASRQAAIQGWDNLVAVPIDQLNAYYQAGLKPAEIADLIVKALGFTAIAIGVSK